MRAWILIVAQVVGIVGIVFEVFFTSPGHPVSPVLVGACLTMIGVSQIGIGLGWLEHLLGRKP